MDEIQELTPKTGVREAAMEKTAPEGEDLPAEKGMLAAEKLREEEQAAENPAADWKAGMTQEEAKRHVRYMKEAIKQAKKAYALGEVPIGCVIVHDGRVIGRGYNRRNTDKNTLSHAEITAIRKASKKLGDWRLEDCALYVTLEPCQMCSGAIVQARIPETVIGCMNPKAGCAGSLFNILEDPRFNHQVHVIRGVLEQECSDMLKQFFQELRVRVKEERKARKAAAQGLTNHPEKRYTE